MLISENNGFDQLDPLDGPIRSASTLTMQALADYSIELLSPHPFFGGEKRALRFQISDQAASVDAPTAAVIAVYDPTGATGGEAAAVLDPAPPTGCQIIGCIWTIPAVSVSTDFLATMAVTMPDGQIRIAEQVITVHP